MYDTLFIQGLTLEASIGCLAWEQIRPQKIVLDIEYQADCREACHSDHIENAVSYAAVNDSIQRIVKSKHFHLVEHLGETLCQQLLEEYPIHSMTIKITKPHAIPNTSGVGIRITRHRATA